jgi:ABC-type nickel/cobalt efflux system permease component RcnA
MSYFLLVGFVLGIRHAFDADHLAAVTTLILGRPTRRESIRIGMAWGFGHALMLLVASSLVLIGGAGIDASYATLFESLAGVMLVVLGLDVVRRAVMSGLHGHAHRHGKDVTHVHFHHHADDVTHAHDPHVHPHAPLTLWRAGCVGLVHGLAGSAALILLTAAATPSLGLALVYVVLFGVGTLAGMALVSTALASPFRLCATAYPARLKLVHGIAGIVSIALGAWLIVEPLLGTGNVGQA